MGAGFEEVTPFPTPVALGKAYMGHLQTLYVAASFAMVGWKDKDPSEILITHNVAEDGAIQFQAMLKELEEGEKYTVRCRAKNERGWSDWSKKSAMMGTAKTSAFRKKKGELSAAMPEKAGAIAAPTATADGTPPPPAKPSESAEGHGPNYLSLSWSMPPGCQVESLEFDVQ